MKPMKTLTKEQQSSLLRGLRNVCRLFWGPDPDICRELMEGTFYGFLQDLERLHRDVAGLNSALQAFLKDYPDSRVLHQTLEEQYVKLFISRKGGIKTPLYHSCHISEGAPLMGPPARMMFEKLQSAGLNLADQFNEPPDHIAIEGEYLYFLLEKGWRGEDIPALKEAGDFAEKTMLPWVEIFRQRLEEDQEGGFYALLAEILCDLLQIISRPLSSEKSGAPF